MSLKEFKISTKIGHYLNIHEESNKDYKNLYSLIEEFDKINIPCKTLYSVIEEFKNDNELKINYDKIKKFQIKLKKGDKYRIFINSDVIVYQDLNQLVYFDVVKNKIGGFNRGMDKFEDFPIKDFKLPLDKFTKDTFCYLFVPISRGYTDNLLENKLIYNFQKREFLLIDKSLIYEDFTVDLNNIENLTKPFLIGEEHGFVKMGNQLYYSSPQFYDVIFFKNEISTLNAGKLIHKLNRLYFKRGLDASGYPSIHFFFKNKVKKFNKKINISNYDIRGIGRKGIYDHYYDWNKNILNFSEALVISTNPKDIKLTKATVEKLFIDGKYEFANFLLILKENFFRKFEGITSEGERILGAVDPLFNKFKTLFNSLYKDIKILENTEILSKI